MSPSSASPPVSPGLSQSLLLLMAVACGLCAGANYFNQPLLHSISVALSVSPAMASATVTMAQVSYALGLLFLVPLGDKLERRNLAAVLMGLAAVGLFLSGFSHHYAMLAAGTLMTGLFSVAAQVLVPMAATLAAPGRAGQAVGLVMSGLLSGILAARSVAGLLSGLGGWNLVYRVAAVAMLLCAIALCWALPRSRPTQSPSYFQVLRSMVTLAAQYPRLRSRALIGALSFGSVSVLFSTMALLLSGTSHGLNDVQIGLVGLVGVAGALMANLTGRLADRGLERRTSASCAVLLCLSWLVIWLGHDSLLWFLTGFFLIDLALPGLHIGNQSVIYALAPEARSRMNAIYMTLYFIGAALGSALGSLAWQWAGWTGTCLAGLGLGLLAGAAVLYDRRLAVARPPQPAV